MKRLLKLKCPNCNADLSFKEERENYFCEYCGTKLLLDNDNEFIYKHIDEAQIKRAEVEKLVKLKELELKEKEMEQKRLINKIMLIISLILGIGAILFFILAKILDEDALDGIGIFACFILLFMWLFKIAIDQNKNEKNN